MRTITTHNGIFHADEVMTIALLRKFYKEEFLVQRTRNPLLIEGANIVIDVGGIYDVEALRFDHHQQTPADGGKSSAGMVLDHTFGEKYPELSDLVSDIDNQDLGLKRQGPWHFCNLISSFNCEEIMGEEQEVAFAKAVDVAYDIVCNIIAKAEALAAKLEVIEEAELTSENGVNFVTLKKGSPFVPAAMLVGKGDFSVSFDEGQNCWSIQAIPLKQGEFGSKFLLEAYDEGNEIFVHKAGFIAKLKELKFCVAGVGVISL